MAFIYVQIKAIYFIAFDLHELENPIKEILMLFSKLV